MPEPTVTRFDTIVVGARIAGAALAIRLARAGQRVLLLDADRLPSDQPLSTHYIHAIGVDWLDELGVGARVRELSPPAYVSRLQMYDAAIDIVYQRGRAGCCIRRSVLDPLLQNAAVAAGAELRDRSQVVELVRDADRVVGVEVVSSGVKQRVYAHTVVGADGRDSTIARLAGAKEYWAYAALRFAYWAYWPVTRAWTQDAELASFDALVTFPRDKAGRFVFHADGDLLLLGVTPPLSELGAWRGNVEAAYLRALRSLPATAKLVENNQRVSNLVGIKKARFFFRDAAGPGFALVGDAGLHKDPTMGLGISDALRDARTLAAAILDGSERALARYHVQRDAASFDLFHFTRDVGDPASINDLTRMVFELVGSRADLLSRLARSVDRELSPYAIVPEAALLRQLVGGLARGRFSLLAPLLGTSIRTARVDAWRRELMLRLARVG